MAPGSAAAPPGGTTGAAALSGVRAASVAAELAPHPAGLLSGLIGVPGTASTTAMAYDAADGYMVLQTPNTTLPAGSIGPSETYLFSGGAWSLAATTNAPSSRQYAAMSYDNATGEVVLFGGYSSAGAYLGDTWTFSHGQWTNITRANGSAPSPRSSAHLAYDAAVGATLLYGGYGPTGGSALGNLTDTWALNASGWTRVATTGGPSPDGSMAYDASLGEILYFGGAGLLTCSTQTYAFSGGLWSDVSASLQGSPGALAFGTLANDPTTGGVVLFGGACGLGIAGLATVITESNTMYALSGATWASVSTTGTIPTARYGGDFAFDVASNEFVLFGGANATTSLLGGVRTVLLDETYTCGNATWAQVGPQLVSSRSIVETGMSFTLSVVGAVAPGATVYTYYGMPTGWTGAGSVVTCAAVIAGTLNVWVNITTLLGFTANTSAFETANATIPVLPHLAVHSMTISRAETEVGVPVSIAANLSGGYGATTEVYRGLPGGCASTNTSSFGCSPAAAGNFTVRLTSTDALGAQANASVPLTVAPRLSLAALSLDHPAIDLHMALAASMFASGGVGPFLETYTGLPEGCLSQNATTFSCTPTATGTFTVGASISDALGVGAAATGAITVNPDPAIGAVSVTGADLSVGTASVVGVSLELTGGTGPFSIAYDGLPGGCAEKNDTTLSCSPTAAGSYRVEITATDSVGFSVSTNATLTVTERSVGVPGGPGATPFAYGSFFEGFGAMLVVLAVLGAALLAQGRARREERTRLAAELTAGVDGAEGAGLADVPPADRTPPAGPSA